MSIETAGRVCDFVWVIPNLSRGEIPAALTGRNVMCQVFAGQDPHRYECTTRRLRINGQSTSIRLENAFWEILDEIANGESVTTPAFISKLHSEVLELRGEPANFTSLLRCACLKATELQGEAGPSSIAAE
jgi:predicted DNA-binding ribbon-helix-helix protein